MFVKKDFFYSLLLLCILVNSTVSALEIVDSPDLLGDLSVEAEQRFYYNDISGNEENSFLTPGANYELNYYISNRHEIPTADGKPIILQFDMDLRATDDPVIDNHTWHITHLYTKVEKPEEYLVEFGDIYSNLSTYSMALAIEGLQGWQEIKIGEKAKIGAQATAGRVFRGIERNNYERKVIGSRLYYSPYQNLQMGINFSRNWDDTGSISDKNLSIDDLSPDSNNVFSYDINLYNADWWIFNAINFYSEIAYSWFDDNIKNRDVNSHYDWAFRWGISGQVEELFLNADYERVNPDFHTNLGSAPADLEQFNLNGTYRLFNAARLSASCRWFRNSLDNSRETPQKSINPQISFLWYDIPFIENLEWELSWRENVIDTKDAPSVSRRDTYYSGLNYYFNQAFVGFSNEYQDVKDSQKNDSHIVNWGLNGGFGRTKIMDWLYVATNANASLNREHLETGRGDNVFLSSRLGIKFYIFDNFYLNNSYFFNDSEITDRGADSTRKGWDVELGYIPQISDKLDVAFNVRYNENKNDYEDSTKDYDERTIEVLCRIVF